MSSGRRVKYDRERCRQPWGDVAAIIVQSVSSLSW